MFWIIALMLGQCEPSVLDNVIKARIELARKELPALPKPPVNTYSLARQQAIKEGKPLLVLVGDAKINGQIPSRFLICKVSEFPDMDNAKQVLKLAIVVSVPEKDDLNYKATLPNNCTIQQIDNIINPVVTVNFQPSQCKT